MLVESKFGTGIMKDFSRFSLSPWLRSQSTEYFDRLFSERNLEIELFPAPLMFFRECEYYVSKDLP